MRTQFLTASIWNANMIAAESMPFSTINVVYDVSHILMVCLVWHAAPPRIERYWNVKVTCECPLRLKLFFVYALHLNNTYNNFERSLTATIIRLPLMSRVWMRKSSIFIVIIRKKIQFCMLNMYTTIHLCFTVYIELHIEVLYALLHMYMRRIETIESYSSNKCTYLNKSNEREHMNSDTLEIFLSLIWFLNLDDGLVRFNPRLHN